MSAPLGSPGSSTGERRWNSRRFALLTAAMLIAAVVMAYWRAPRVPFFFDDLPGIERNPSIRQLWPLAPALTPPVTAAGAAGRPVVNFTLALNYAIGGLDPRGYHWFNIGLHAVVALLLFGVARHALRRGDIAGNPRDGSTSRADLITVALVLLWAVHPLVTESVVCVIQRNELLVAACLLSTLYCVIRAALGGAKTTAWKLAAITSCAIGMASKETMVGAPLIVLLYDRAFLAGSFTAAWRLRRRLYAALATTWMLLAYLVASHENRAGTVGFGLGTSWWDYLVTQASALCLYLKLCFWPHPLVLDYGFEVVPGLVSVWPQAALVLGLLIATVVALLRAPAVGFVAAAFFILLGPSSSVIPLTTQTIAEHRMYLPSAAVIALIAVGLPRVCSWLRWAFAPIVLSLLALTAARIEVYRSEKTIWEDTLAQRPSNARAWSSVAHVRVDEGQWRDALRLYDQAVALRPDYADTQNDYANVLLHEGQLDAALAHYRAARRLKPQDNDIQFNYSGALVQAGDLAGAFENLVAVLARDPKNLKALNNLGDVALKLDRPEPALHAFESALALEPLSGIAHNNAAVALMRLGRYAEAVAYYEAALRQLGDSALIHHNLALALDGAGRPAESADHERIALRLNPQYAGAREHLTDLERRGRR